VELKQHQQQDQEVQVVEQNNVLLQEHQFLVVLVQEMIHQ